MKIITLVLSAILTVLSLNLQAQGETKTGIVIAYGGGSITTEEVSTFHGQSYMEYKSNIYLGYRCRLYPASIEPFSFDIEVGAGIKSTNSSYTSIPTGSSPDQIYYPNYDASSKYYFASASGIFNYAVFKRFNIGVGIEPTYYFFQQGEDSSNKFDIPAVGRISYDIKFFEIGVSYKHSFMNSLKTEYLESGKFREWQISFWIPF